MLLLLIFKINLKTPSAMVQTVSVLKRISNLSSLSSCVFDKVPCFIFIWWLYFRVYQKYFFLIFTHSAVSFVSDVIMMDISIDILAFFLSIILKWTTSLLKLLTEFRKLKEVKQYMTILPKTSVSVLKIVICSLKLNPRSGWPTIADYDDLKTQGKREANDLYL